MNIKFADEESHKAFCEALADDSSVPKGERTLGDCILGLLRWSDDSTATIALDPWRSSSGAHDFTFAEEYPDGRRGIFGGIVYHTLYKDDGKTPFGHCYGIHT